MVTNDATILRIKHDVLYEVAKLAWNGELDEEHKDQVPYTIIPGPQAQFRCCIYKEREIIRQRVRLAEGKCPTSGKDSRNVVQVIGAACEECPIASYTVTDNCRKCMGKACQNSCNFGAISMGDTRAHIDPNKCKECGKCANACPYNAIAHLERPCKKACPVDAITYDEYGVCEIDENKCIQCGACIHSCPFGAVGAKTFMVDVINMINAGKKVVAMVAPATEGQFGADITMASWKTALKKVGFADMVEDALGGDMTAAAEAAEEAQNTESDSDSSGDSEDDYGYDPDEDTTESSSSSTSSDVVVEEEEDEEDDVQYGNSEDESSEDSSSEDSSYDESGDTSSEETSSDEAADTSADTSSDSGSSSQGTYLGNFTLTAYCNCAQCCGTAGNLTASGTVPTAGRTVAMAGVPFGTKLLINGTVYTVEDLGTPYGHVDIYCGSHSEALSFGLQSADVYQVG